MHNENQNIDCRHEAQPFYTNLGLLCKYCGFVMAPPLPETERQHATRRVLNEKPHPQCPGDGTTELWRGEIPPASQGHEASYVKLKADQKAYTEPDVCPICKWVNRDLLNYGDPGIPDWMCHGCAKRAIDSRKASLELIAKICESTKHIDQLGDILREAKSTLSI